MAGRKYSLCLPAAENSNVPPTWHTDKWRSRFGPFGTGWHVIQHTAKIIDITFIVHFISNFCEFILVLVVNDLLKIRLRCIRWGQDYREWDWTGVTMSCGDYRLGCWDMRQLRYKEKHTKLEGVIYNLWHLRQTHIRWRWRWRRWWKVWPMVIWSWRVHGTARVRR